MRKIYVCLILLISLGVVVPSVALSSDQRDYQRDNQRERKGQKREMRESQNRPNQRNYYNDRYRNSRVKVVRERRQDRENLYFRPQWHPRHDFERRWVYFPKYNMYWDNYRGVYVYNSNGRWVTYKKTPRFILNVNLAQEKFFELGFEFDSRGDAFRLNAQHRSRFK